MAMPWRDERGGERWVVSEMEESKWVVSEMGGRGWLNGLNMAFSSVGRGTMRRRRPYLETRDMFV